MDKKAALMVRKPFLLIRIVIFAVLLSGCNTVKGTAAGAASGAQQDLESMKKADGWLKKNLW
jgi:predicted small secreted protein